MLEVFSDGRAPRLEKFRVTKGYGFRGVTTFKTMHQDKGRHIEMELYIARVDKGGVLLIPFGQSCNVNPVSFAAMKSAKYSMVAWREAELF